MKSVYFLISLAFLSGVLFALPWLGIFTYSVFIAFVPLLFIENIFFENKQTNTSFSVLPFVILTFFLWNGIALWWAYKPSVFGFVAPVFVNTSVMSFVFWAFHFVKRKPAFAQTLWILPIFWLAFEYIHFNWEFTFPWLTLGNALAYNINLVQWYEFTGALGGSFWILSVNIVVFELFRSVIVQKKFILKIILLVIILVVPILLSLKLTKQTFQNTQDVNVLIIQPNINSYTEKFQKFSPVEQVEKLIVQTEKNISENLDIVVFPETAIPKNMKEIDIEQNELVLPVKNMLLKYPNISVITGAYTFQQFDKKQNIPATATNLPGSPLYFDYYNSALFIDTGKIQIYHKSKLLIGPETMPFVETFTFLRNMKVNLPGGSSTYGRQEKASVFQTKFNKKIATLVCWESEYGEYFGDFVKLDAQLFCIITNDGWWGNTEAHRTHLKIAQLRAIENRKYVVRCANTGISAIINPYGDVIQQIPYETQNSISGSVQMNNYKSFYSKYGDSFWKFLTYLALILFNSILFYENFRKYFTFRK